jgi:translation elongation factor EF-Ts
MDCKHALEEAGGDYNLAKQIIGKNHGEPFFPRTII